MNIQVDSIHFKIITAILCKRLIVMLKKLSIGFILLLFAIMSPDNSFGFNREFRITLMDDAIKFCPQDLKEFLNKNHDELMDGMLFLSRNRKSFHMSDIEDVIECHYNNIIKEFKAGKLNEDSITRSFGLIACSISEIICPGKIYTSHKLVPDTVRRENYQEITNVEKEILGLIEKYKPYHNNYRKEVIAFLYGEAVNSVVNFWISVWNASGHKINDINKIKPEIDHKIYVIKNNGPNKYISGSKVPKINNSDRQSAFIWLHPNQ